MTNQLTINFFHRHYTNFDREKLFLEKSSIILLIGSRKITPKENCPPALIITLILNQTLTLTGGQFSRHAFDYKSKISGVNEQGFLCARWVKDIWNSKEKKGLQNCKSYMLKLFRASIFAKNVFKHHGTLTALMFAM